MCDQLVFCLFVFIVIICLICFFRNSNRCSSVILFFISLYGIYATMLDMSSLNYGPFNFPRSFFALVLILLFIVFCLIVKMLAFMICKLKRRKREGTLPPHHIK